MDKTKYKNQDWLYGHYVDLQESTTVMAQKAGCSHGTIWNWLRKFDIPTRSPDERALYRDNDWLYKHYVVLQESTTAMAQEAGCGQTTIGRWLHKFDIPISDPGEGALYRNRDWLYEHYVIREESMPVMAKIAGCTRPTIYDWLHRFCIPTRNISESSFLAKRNRLILLQGLLDSLEGELLGDGHLQLNPGCRSAYYSHTSKYREYVVWLSSKFDKLGMGQVGKICSHQNKKRHNWAYHYNSISYPELVPIRKRWYPEGKKIVPKDLKLNPTVVRHWFLGDGSLCNQAKGRPSIKLSTCAFDKASIDYLLKELRDNGFKVNHWPSNNTIGMSVYSVKDFLSWIGPCPIDCYQYKWDYRDNRKSVRGIMGSSR